jgi:hypothetical protein
MNIAKVNTANFLEEFTRVGGPRKYRDLYYGWVGLDDQMNPRANGFECKCNAFGDNYNSKVFGSIIIKSVIHLDGFNILILSYDDAIIFNNIDKAVNYLGKELIFDIGEDFE